MTATAYYSAVLEQPVHTVWPLIRDFNNYPAYIEGVTDSVIENGKRGDEVGAVRRFLYRGNWIRQRLSAHSDERHSLTYTGIDPLKFPAGDASQTPPPAAYKGTIHLLPIVDGGRTFIEWSVTVEARAEDADSWRRFLLSLIPTWISSLKRTLDRGIPDQP